MSEALLELLAPHFEEVASGAAKPDVKDTTTLRYLNRLTTLQLSALSTTEPQSLAQASHSNLLSIQALSTRSSKSVVKSVDELKGLQETLPDLVDTTNKTRNGVSGLDKSILRFADKYSRSGENEVLDRRKKALLMSRNIDRLSDLLELPSLLASTISASAQQGSAGHTNYASALDLHSYIRRLHLTYPGSAVLQSLYDAAEASLADMKTNLIASLRGPSVKLTAGMRTIGWLRRIIPQLAGPSRDGIGNLGEGSFGAVFLAGRLANLLTTLSALEPLRELANLETERRLAGGGAGGSSSSAWAGGQQTERYLKRFIEIFREQSFAAVSLFKSVFPADEGQRSRPEDLGLPPLQGLESGRSTAPANPLLELPSALATFPAHLVELLTDTLRAYLPNVTDRSSRESLLTQVLYCAGSLGRLGADFGMMLALLDEDESGGEEDGALDWAAVMKKHRVLSGRLESLASRPGPRTGASSNVQVNG